MNDGAVMIVDDSLTVRMDLAEAFAAEGLRAITCDTAAAARATLARESVALVVLDVLLPDGNGVDLMKEIRATYAGADIPILLLSTEADVRDRIRGLVTGSNDYVGKPYDREYVVARARELIGRSKGSATANATVLVIDDSVTFREELCDALKTQGYNVLGAESGEEGLRSAATHRPTAVVVDGVLPGIDGATVVRKLRLDAALRQTPCVLLTGSTTDLSAELRALDAGADAFVRKEEDLNVILARVAAVLRSAAEGADRETASLLGPKKILAVDDSITYLNELTSVLRGEGYDVIQARSGEEALEMLAVQPVDCLLLDLLMPGLNGTETCRRVKASAATRDIPLIMLTANEDREAMIEALSTGADDYVLKSSEDEVLKARLRAQLRRKQIEDESRHIRVQLLRTELEAAEARAARKLAETRAKLVEELEDKNCELEALANEAHQAEEKFRALAQSAADAIVSVDQRGVIVYANPTIEHMFGYTLTELIGQAFTRLMPQQFHEANSTEFRRYLSGGEAHVVVKGIVELAGRRKDGREFPLELSLAEWRLGEERYFTAIMRNITARREAEEHIRALNQDLEHRAVELASANKELEAFSYSVSHDLRAPLRAIDGFSLILLEDHSAMLDSAGREALQTVRRAAQHMGALIDDLLKLSHVTRTELVREEVNLGGLARSIADTLQKQEPQRSVEFAISSELSVLGDPRLLRIVLDNLLGNAWKFTGKRVDARIEVGVDVKDGESVYYVRDNGAGFDMEYADKLFGPFQRLHTAEEFPGTGIGLATVQRIILKHGGRIWAESIVNAGAAFFFTLSQASKPETRHE